MMFFLDPYLPLAQVFPCQPLGQSQENEPKLLIQIPPLEHGE